MPTSTADKFVDTINTNLDKLEEALPTIPAKILHLQRAAAQAYYDRTSEFWQSVADSTKGFFDSARVSGKTVVGQARAATEDVVETAQHSAKTVAGQARAAADDVTKAARSGAHRVSGQARAQGKKLSTKAEASTTRVLDKAIDTVEDRPSSGTAYEQWTKKQLLERANELKIAGRNAMSKPELIEALRAQ